jgi:hypothetical protein
VPETPHMSRDQPAQGDGVEVEQIAGEDRLGLGPQERPAGRAGPTGRPPPGAACAVTTSAACTGRPGASEDCPTCAASLPACTDSGAELPSARVRTTSALILQGLFWRQLWVAPVSERDVNPHAADLHFPVRDDDHRGKVLVRELCLCPRGDLRTDHTVERQVKLQSLRPATCPLWSCWPCAWAGLRQRCRRRPCAAPNSRFEVVAASG